MAQGVVEEVGPGVTPRSDAAGDRVPNGIAPLGAYSEERLIRPIACSAARRIDVHYPAAH